MAQAGQAARPITFLTAPFAALAAVIAALVLAIGALAIPPLISAPTTVPERSDAVLQSGRDWQVRYEQMSGLDARREQQRQAAVQAGREWQERYEQMYGGE